MARIEGYVKSIRFRNEDNGYTVLTLETNQEDETVVGKFSFLQEGEFLSVQGNFIHHPVHGVQLQAESYQVRTPEDVVSMERYLGSGAIAGIGPVLASRIMKKFKEDAFRIIEEEPERLAEIKGISERKAREIAIVFHEKQEMRQSMVFLGQYGISTQYAVRIYQRYGDDLYDIVRKNPYRLADEVSGIGFRIADDIASKVGIQSDSGYRIKSALYYVLQQANTWGHVYYPVDKLIAKTEELLGFAFEDMAKLEDYFLELIMEKKIICKYIEEMPVAYSYPFYFMELSSARRLLDLKRTCEIQEEILLKSIEQLQKNSGIVLEAEQRNAVVAAAKHDVVIITGGPGTGKTTVISALIHYFEKEKKELLLAAPTGRAAKRMSETTGYEAQTIHRMLELSGDVEGGNRIQFERNESNPLDADVIIVDEMSMVDIALFNSLLAAIVPGTKLIMVGDSHQLPSVGPGNVLEDLIQSEAFTVIKLTKIFRQSEGSDMIINAHKIHNGESLDITNKNNDFFFMKRMNVQQILGVVISLVRDKLPKYVQAPSGEIQVLTPMRKGELGVENLNKVLQEYLNPPSPDKKEKEAGQVLFREGDKVMQIKNNYKLEWQIIGRTGFTAEEGVGVFNGDIGIIHEINFFSEEVIVVFDEEKRVRYGFSMLDELELAYAITVHKAQGSEYPAVVLPLLSGPQVLCNRNLLYTAVTRAKQCVTIVGSEWMLEQMIQNDKSMERYSSLAWRIKEMITPDCSVL